jgi:hypothetical protein
VEFGAFASLLYNQGLSRDLATRLYFPADVEAVQTGHDRMEKHETRYSSRLSSRNGALCLRAYLSDALDG